MPVFSSTKFYFTFKWPFVVGIMISAAAIVTAVVSVTLSLLILVIPLKVLIPGVLTSTSIGCTSGCNGRLLCRLAAAAAVWLCRANRHLFGAASILVGFLLLLPVLPAKFSTCAFISRILRTAAAAYS
jgi:hypothetical protein